MLAWPINSETSVCELYQEHHKFLFFEFADCIIRNGFYNGAMPVER